MKDKERKGNMCIFNVMCCCSLHLWSWKLEAGCFPGLTADDEGAADDKGATESWAVFPFRVDDLTFACICSFGMGSVLVRSWASFM